MAEIRGLALASPWVGRGHAAIDFLEMQEPDRLLPQERREWLIR